ncbi:hypothetical protein ORI20_14175 [Mycobacterium sp. CVI_P3]|uniref:Uncharacterized protein n=1 Tax=Mycobacterium pinniadriaticum TaxID=2994102 RepID=A0ABT3SG41_9MYCO|nr:hypothetical protein [Mycobacterium pinniadriaticum]MCX2931428.1 hypothetical protein [Mycobacterium pinniadriaticum]MCX2937852.1 hypothetical protein [Mycobacterium pinniadriaticum]
MLKLFLVLIAACAAAEWFWWIVGTVAVIVLGVYVARGYRAAAAEDRAERASARRHARELAARADEQNALILAGDDRGMYGENRPAITAQSAPAQSSVEKGSRHHVAMGDVDVES